MAAPPEPERRAALHRDPSCNPDAAQDFADFALLATQICGTPIEVIRLLDENQSRPKATKGPTGNEPVHDLDSCVGSPLLTPDGNALGLRCVTTQPPPELNAGQKAALQALGRQLVVQLELRSRLQELQNTVTRLQHATADLNWKTAFLEAQANSSLDGILVVDPKGRQILQNRQMAELLKLPPDLTDNTDDEKQLHWVTGTIKNPGQFIQKVVYLNAHPDEVSRDEIELNDGTTLDRYSSPVVGQEGEYYGRIWTFRDLTGRKRAETALLESKRFLKSALDALSSHIAILDELGSIIEVNAAWNRFARENNRLGGHRAVGDNYLQLCDSAVGRFSEEAPAVAAGIRAVLAGLSEEFHLEYPCHSSSEQRWFVVRVTRFPGEGPVRAVVAHENITERKLAEMAVRESNEKFHQLADNLTDVFWIRSPDMREVQYISPAFERIWGRSVASLYANPQQWPDLILPEDRERVLGAFAKFRENSPSLEIEYRIVRPAGEIRWVYLRASQVRDAAGKVVRITGIVTDITARKQVDARLIQSQKMETVGKLAGGIAHEFNSILTAIIGQSELLLGGLPAGSPLVENAAEINKAAGRAATLTRQLLAYGRKQFLRPEILDLNQVLAGMEGMLRLLVGNDVDIRIVPAAGLHQVKADAGQVEQVIMNLAINAREAMPGGGKLTLETANVSFDAESADLYEELKPGDYVLLALTDSGTGMSKEVEARVFEPFFTTKDVGQGTGLGLSTCYGIIKQSGGHISVYSELGRGTTFKIYLPRVEALPKPPVRSLDSPNLPRGTETILLAEDDPILREMAATLLRRLGYTVLTATNGVEALSLSSPRDAGRIDLLFTDVVMPHMDGKELADRVRALHPHTRILFTSAYTENAILHQGGLMQGVALLQKPFMPSALARKVREVLDDSGK